MGKWVKTGFVIALFGIVSAQWEESQGTDVALRDLFVAAQEHITAMRRGVDAPDAKRLLQALSKLQSEVEKDSQFKVDRHTRTVFDVEAHPRIVFGTIPKLPAEDKKDNRWSFSPTTFQVIPQSLYVFGIKFKARRTIRLKTVTLHFRDGSRIVHDIWAVREEGNGQAFQKRKYIPLLPAFDNESVRQAKALSAIEILGSAQDRDHDAQLDFVFRIPDPSARPFLPALEKITDVARQWSQEFLDSKDWAEHIATDITAIATILGRKAPNFETIPNIESPSPN